MIKRVLYEPTNTEYDQIICDVTGYILRDHVALQPGYIDVKDGIATIHFSDDPDNNIRPGHPDYKQFIEQRQGVKNKIIYERVNIIPYPDAPDGHYRSHEVLVDYLLNLPQTPPAREDEGLGNISTRPLTDEEIKTLPRCTTCDPSQETINPSEHYFLTYDHPYPNPDTNAQPVDAPVTPPPIVDNTPEVG